MRTTITIAEDVAEAMEQLRRDEGLGPSAALNHLARRGMAAPSREPSPYVHRSMPLGAKVDVANTAEVLDLLDEDESAP